MPWRTLTGRQHFYLDHPCYVAFGENLPAYKPQLSRRAMGELTTSTAEEGASLVLNFLTPHGKWHIHSTYSDNLRMLTLSRGLDPCWLNDKDAASIGIADNDWVEVYNDNGVMVTRAAVSARVQPGTCMIYHAPERTIVVPKSQVRGNRRAGGAQQPDADAAQAGAACRRAGAVHLRASTTGGRPASTATPTACVKKLERLEW